MNNITPMPGGKARRVAPAVKPLKHDAKAAWSFVQQIASPASPLFTITVLSTKSPGMAPTITLDASDFEAFDHLQQFLSDHTGWNVYYQPNAPRSKASRKLSRDDIADIRAIYVDIDPKAGPFEEAQADVFEQVHMAARGRLGPKPTHVIKSGGGAQLLYVLPTPILNANEDQRRDVEEINTRLRQVHGGDPATCHIATLLRLPGTVNQQDSERKQGRPRVLATVSVVEKRPTARFTICDLDLALPDAPPRPQVERRSATKNMASPRMMAQLRSALKHCDQELIEIEGGEISYDQWVKVGMALHAETNGSDEGFQLFDGWSATSGKYNTGQTTEHLWNNVHNKSEGKANGLVSGATILKMAEDHGWTNLIKVDEPLPPFTPNRNAGYSFPAVDGEHEDDLETGTATKNNVQFLDDLDRAGPYIPNWLIPDFLPQGVSAVLWGMPGSLKTTGISYAAFCAATGVKWFGQTLPQFGTLCCSMESSDHTRNTFHGFLTQHRDEIHARREAGTLKKTAIGIMDTPLGLYDPHGKATPGEKEIIKRALSFRESHGVDCRLIVLDTLARVLIGGNENDASDIATLSAAIERIVKATGATVIVLHHATKDGGDMRGSGALTGNFEGVIKATRSNDRGELEVMRLKGVRAGSKLQYRSKEIKIAEYPNGKPLNSFVLHGVQTNAGFDAVPEEGDADEVNPVKKAGAPKRPNSDAARVAMIVASHLATNTPISTESIREYMVDHKYPLPTDVSLRKILGRLVKDGILARCRKRGIFKAPPPPDYDSVDEV